jgi:hypothetical protein
MTTKKLGRAYKLAARMVNRSFTCSQEQSDFLDNQENASEYLRRKIQGDMDAINSAIVAGMASQTGARPDNAENKE